MAGSLSRDIGLRAERGMVNWLRANGYPQARRLLAGDGRQQGDIDGLGCCIEVKAGKTLRLNPWLAQVDAERGDLVGFLVWKPPGIVNPADWWVFFRAPSGDIIRTSVGHLWGT